MNDPIYQQLLEINWQRKLTAAEEAQLQEYLTTHPEAKEDLLADRELTQLLDQLPEAPPVASNFTALVLQAVERENARNDREARIVPARWPFRRWLSWVVPASLVVCLGFLAFREHELSAKEAMARNVNELTSVVSASPELMTDFDPIFRLNDAPPKADTELLALMK